MFDSKSRSASTSSDLVLDAVDLVIDFATLGEYGLEPVADRASRPCEGRRRTGNPRRSTGAWNSAIARFAVQP